MYEWTSTRRRYGARSRRSRQQHLICTGSHATDVCEATHKLASAKSEREGSAHAIRRGAVQTSDAARCSAIRIREAATYHDRISQTRPHRRCTMSGPESKQARTGARASRRRARPEGIMQRQRGRIRLRGRMTISGVGLRVQVRRLQDRTAYRCLVSMVTGSMDANSMPTTSPQRRGRPVSRQEHRRWPVRSPRFVVEASGRHLHGQAAGDSISQDRWIPAISCKAES